MIKAFKVIIRPPKAHDIIEVIWTTYVLGWIKAKFDGASVDNPKPSWSH